MKEENINDNPVSRRKFLGASLVLPFLPMVKPLNATAAEQKTESDFVIMLNAEGKAVKVNRSALKDAKVIDKKMSNQTLLSWLKPKESNSK